MVQPGDRRGIIRNLRPQTHVSRLLMKLDARDRAQLIVIAYETGLVKAHPRPP